MSVSLNFCINLIKKIFPNNHEEVISNYKNPSFMVMDITYVLECCLELHDDNLDLDSIADLIAKNELAKSIIEMSLYKYIEVNTSNSLYINSTVVVYNTQIQLNSLSDKIYDEVENTISKRKMFDYRNASCCDPSLRSYGRNGIIYVTKDSYCLSKEAFNMFANKMKLSTNDIFRALEYNKYLYHYPYNIWSCVTITDKDGKKYTRKVYRISRSRGDKKY